MRQRASNDLINVHRWIMGSMLGLLFVLSASAQTNNSLESVDSREGFVIQRGWVVVTPSFCPPDQCERQRSRLEGRFVASITEDGLRFTQSNLRSSADIAFQLPFDPNVDSNGTTRQAIFKRVGDFLLIRGRVNASAFDGPVTDYYLVARFDSEQSVLAPTLFYELKNEGIFCISSPCFSFSATLLNASEVSSCEGPSGKKAGQCPVPAPITLSRIDFPEDPALSEAVFQARSRLGDGETLIILGRVENYQGFAGPGRALRVKDWFVSGRRLPE